MRIKAGRGNVKTSEFKYFLTVEIFSCSQILNLGFFFNFGYKFLNFVFKNFQLASNQNLEI